MVEQIRLPFPGKELVEQGDDILLTSLIFLKARNDIKQAKIGIGCVVRNRVNNPRWWGKNYKQIAYSLTEFFRLSEQEKNLVLFPVSNNINDKWDECYLIAKGILDNTIQDITYNSDFFFTTSEKLPGWLSSKHRHNTVSQWYVSTMGEIQFYRVELKWNNGNPT
jgi:hypothetical protein